MLREIRNLKHLHIHLKRSEAVHEDWVGHLYDIICRLEEQALVLGFDIPRDERYNKYVR